MPHEHDDKWEEVCAHFCHVSNRQAQKARQDRQACGSIEMSMF